MRDHSQHIELTREAAIRALVEAADFKPAIETAAVGDAHMRVTARACAAAHRLAVSQFSQIEGVTDQIGSSSSSEMLLGFFGC